MTELQKVLAWSEAEAEKLFHAMPAIIKKYGTEALHVSQQIKTALASPEAAGIEAAVTQMLGGTWEGAVVTAITKALNIVIPTLTGIEDHANLPILQQGEAFVAYLKAQSPKMQHAGLIKLVSGIFQALDPTLSEVGADSAAQVLYAHTSTATAAPAGTL